MDTIDIINSALRSETDGSLLQNDDSYGCEEDQVVKLAQALSFIGDSLEYSVEFEKSASFKKKLKKMVQRGIISPDQAANINNTAELDAAIAAKADPTARVSGGIQNSNIGGPTTQQQNVNKLAKDKLDDVADDASKAVKNVDADDASGAFSKFKNFASKNKMGLGIGAGIAALGTGAYLMNRNKNQQPQQQMPKAASYLAYEELMDLVEQEKIAKNTNQIKKRRAKSQARKQKKRKLKKLQAARNEANRRTKPLASSGSRAGIAGAADAFAEVNQPTTQRPPTNTIGDIRSQGRRKGVAQGAYDAMMDVNTASDSAPPKMVRTQPTTPVSSGDTERARRAKMRRNAKKLRRQNQDRLRNTPPPPPPRSTATPPPPPRSTATPPPPPRSTATPPPPPRSTSTPRTSSPTSRKTNKSPKAPSLTGASSSPVSSGAATKSPSFLRRAGKFTGVLGSKGQSSSNRFARLAGTVLGAGAVGYGAKKAYDSYNKKGQGTKKVAHLLKLAEDRINPAKISAGPAAPYSGEIMPNPGRVSSEFIGNTRAPKPLIDLKAQKVRARINSDMKKYVNNVGDGYNLQGILNKMNK